MFLLLSHVLLYYSDYCASTVYYQLSNSKEKRGFSFEAVYRYEVYCRTCFVCTDCANRTIDLSRIVCSQKSRLECCAQIAPTCYLSCALRTVLKSYFNHVFPKRHCRAQKREIPTSSREMHVFTQRGGE